VFTQFGSSNGLICCICSFVSGYSSYTLIGVRWGQSASKAYLLQPGRPLIPCRVTLLSTHLPARVAIPAICTASEQATLTMEVSSSRPRCLFVCPLRPGLMSVRWHATTSPLLPRSAPPVSLRLRARVVHGPRSLGLITGRVEIIC
jgi:hypothetical protein